MAGPRKTTGTTKRPGAPAKPRGTGGGAGKAGGAAKTAAKAPPVKLVEPAPAPEITVVTPAEPVMTERMVKKVELIDRVMTATGMKRKDVKPIVEAMLGEIDKIISEGADMQFPELGKLMIHKRKEISNGEMVMLKLRRKTAVKPLAEDDDNG
ncbi:HU family DNA-binding protein [Oceanicola sp. 502str15]|uniref:HU family DNA-binding protein n=1 Tax=Oceanicola sp. 502str15 TaxID=2696061 RepID=UPI0020945658|nr:HU family DNA-binding protein [Oceanicola sp. 502str15]MCO6382260.1 hypothetical protein [Oceanicola sp. 502str15]